MKSLFCMFCTLAIASSVSAQETGNAMLKYGLNFLKTPYVAHTLEVNEEEKLVVNFDEVDCTTFVEYVLALSLSPVKTMQEFYKRYAIATAGSTVILPACTTLPTG